MIPTTHPASRVCSVSSNLTVYPVFLTDSGAINGDPTRSHILDLEAHDIAASKFAVDGKVEHGKVEHGKVACSALELQPLPLFQGVRPACCAVIWGDEASEEGWYSQFERRCAKTP